MREALKVWIKNEKKIEEAIINGEKIEVLESDFGANEFVIDFLKEAEKRKKDQDLGNQWTSLKKVLQRRKRKGLSGLFHKFCYVFC